jgi:RimJ/RimL family protein N-acetyltransferase
MTERGAVRIEPWGTGDLALLQACLGDPAMMHHLGGPERAEKIAERQARYEKPDSKQFKIVDEATGAGVGWVGYWERDARGDQVYEIGWSVIPAHQGRGIAGAAARDVIGIARAEAERRFLHAYPAVDNTPSNAVCRKLGFTLLGTYAFEYPPGNTLRCNDWRLDLFAGRSPRQASTSIHAPACATGRNLPSAGMPGPAGPRS